MGIFSFQTIKNPATGLYKEKGSKFHAFAFPVFNETEVKSHLEDLRKKYFDARHHCYAYRLGPEGLQYRAVDDGEPNHSAGDPILGQIRSKNLTNILIVVVRYFGGIKLGVGGLISAYKLAAEDALAQCQIITVEVTEELQLLYSYSSTPEVMRLIKEFNLNVIHQTFEDECTARVQFSVRDKERLLEKLKLLQATGTSISF